ncbi:hypothetical protein, partial [Escherichia coli]|uniref:hypothetical protein n=1 Tax=Escherichia coli TaxID=562 RepID=UPI002025AEBB
HKLQLIPQSNSASSLEGFLHCSHSMSTDWQKILLAAVFADHLLYDQLSPYYQNCFYAKYRIGT